MDFTQLYKERFWQSLYFVALFLAVVFTVLFLHPFAGAVFSKLSAPYLIFFAVIWSLLFVIGYFKLMAVAGFSKPYAFMYLMILVGSLFQVANIFTYNPVSHIFSDPARHWDQGNHLLRIDIMTMTDPIMYQIYIAMVAKITLKFPILVAYVTSVLALLGPWAWYKFFKELQSNKLVSLGGWALLSLLPSWTGIYSYFMQETLMIPLLGGSLWATWRCKRKADLQSFLLMVLFWILAGLTRGIAIPMAAVCCTWLWFEQENKVKKSVMSLLILGLILGPLAYRSYKAVGLFAPHGIGHMNMIYALSGKKEIHIKTHRQGGRWLHGFGSPSMGAKPFAPFSDWTSQREGRVVMDIDLDKGGEDWDKELAKLNLTFGQYLWMTKENLIFLLFSESWPDNNPVHLIEKINNVSRFMWAPLALIMIIWMVAFRRKLKGHWLLPSIILAWFIVQGLIPIVPAEGRYRKPLEGLIVAQFVLLAGLALGATRDAVSKYGAFPLLISKLQIFRQRLRDKFNGYSSRKGVE